MPRLRINNALISAAVLALILMAGCGADDTSPITVKGELGITGDNPIPDGANARISLSEPGEEGAEKRIVAERTLHDLGQKPIAFKLEVARNLLAPQGIYELSAEVIAGDGVVLWHSADTQRIKPLQQNKTVRLQLDAAEPDTQTQFQKYRCEDGFKLSAWKNSDQAVVRLGNRRLDLDAQEKSVVYIDKHENTLSVADDSVDVNIDGAAHKSCEPVEESTAQPSSAESIDAEAQLNAKRGSDAASAPSQEDN